MERRLAAILAADVVGYSPLMEADEETTLSTLNQPEMAGRLVGRLGQKESPTDRSRTQL